MLNMVNIFVWRLFDEVGLGPNAELTLFEERKARPLFTDLG